MKSLWMVNNLDEFRNILYTQREALLNVSEYLNDAGLAKKDAISEMAHLSNFANSLEDFYNMEEFQNLLDVPEQNPEYYKTIRIVRRLLEYLTNTSEE